MNWEDCFYLFSSDTHNTNTNTELCLYMCGATSKVFTGHESERHQD